jgi:hypothetical protein
MQSSRWTSLALALVAAPALGTAQGAPDLESAFQATRGCAADAAGAAFRRVPGAARFLCAKLDCTPNERLLAIDHLQRMPSESTLAADDLLALAAVPDACGGMAAIAIGNVAPWWPEHLRLQAQRVLLDRFANRRVGVQERSGLSRSHTRAGLCVTTDLARIEAMLVSGDPFEIEFGLHQLELREHAGRALLPLLRKLAEQKQWLVEDRVRGVPRELPCTCDWTNLIRDRLYWAVRRIDPADPMLLAFYLERWPKAAAWQQFDFLQMFGRMGPAAAPALPQITELTRSRDRLLAREAVTVIGMIGVADQTAVARLHELSVADDPQLATCARSALRQVERSAPRD